MASFDYRLNPLYPIKECSSCGALYTTDYCCSEGSLRDKIICNLNKTHDLSQRLPQNCAKCGNPVDGHYCQGCALLRKKFKEDLFTYCIENGIFQDFQDTSEPSNDNTNVVNALQEPFIVKQDPSENSSQRPPQINHHCCYGCGDLLEDIFCHQCTCVKFLQEKRNQIDFVKTFLRKFNRISFYEMPKVLSLAWEIILEIELAFKDKHCQPKDILESFQRLHNNVQNIHEELAVYINTSSWDRPTICYSNDDDEDCTITITPILSTKEPDNSLSMGDKHLDTIPATESDEVIKSSVENLVLIPNQFEDFSDSNDDSTSIDDDSFSIDNITYIEASPLDSELLSLEVIEIVILKVGGIDDDILLTIKDDILHEKLLNINFLIANIEALKDNPTPSSDFMTKSSSASLNILLEETITFDNSLPESKTFCFDLEEISSGNTTTRSDISLPDYEAFYDDHVKEISSGSTTTHYDSSLYDAFIFNLSINPFPPVGRSDFYEFVDELAYIISPPEYDCFCFKNEPNSGDFTMDVVEDIFPTREPRVHVHNVLPTQPTLQLNLDFILSSESLFAYVIWIFLPFLSYSVAPQYLLSFENEDTIFDPGISSYHISSFIPDVSHRSGTFIKFNVYPKHLNGSPMEILFSLLSHRPMNLGSSQAQDSVNKN
uniref:Pre-mRNA splicing Prp18-interacting factor n=1 Tax=Tanacetum cinerariifolium TaxID=118510 RepID=A0A6L2PC18_TANCI|nr:hypothetical protein [Tanacetum cinerariifolium]